MIFKLLKKCCQLTALIIVITSIERPALMAAELSQVSIDDSEFLLLDVTLQQKRLLESIEAYQFEEQVLLPVNLLISALGAGIEVNLVENTLLYTSAGSTTVIELDKGSTSLPDGTYYWAKDDFEIYLSDSILAALLEASIKVQFSRLNVELKSIDNLFPIEVNWQRSNQLKKRESKKSKKALYIPDTYQLITPPSADISLSVGKQSDNDFNGAFSLQSSSDLLYHSAAISLHKNLNDSEMTSRINFTRHQSTPDTPLWGGLNQYSFGDISSGGSALFSSSSSGLGLKFSRRPQNVSNNFGTQNIDGNATPGWEVELHYNGFLVESKIVPDNGYYVFENVTTDYGNNHFEIRLYGPFGEEDIRNVNINIGSNWLPKGEFAYNGYMLDANKTLLNGVVDESIIDSQLDYGASLDYSPFNNTHIGYFFQSVGSKRKVNSVEESNLYFGTHVQSAFNDLLLDIEYVRQQKQGQRITAQGIGQFPWGQNYNVVLQEQRNFATTTATEGVSNYLASFATGGVLPLQRGIGYRAGLTYNGSNNNASSWLLNSSLSWRFSNLHFSNSLNYRINNIENVDNSLLGNLAVSSKVGNVRLRASANYALEPISYFSSTSFGASWRASPKSYHNLNASYQPKYKYRAEDSWSLGYTYSTTLELLRFYTNADINSKDQWSVNLGVNFFLDYDAHNNKFIMSGENASSAGHLNIISYLDRNDNNRRDEGDWLLDDVGFLPLPAWRNSVTNQFGQASLSGVPVFNPVTFTANSNIDVATKQPNYTVYTHPGSRLNIELPFTIKTNIFGFVEIEGVNGEQALTTGSIILLNQNTDESTELMIDIDGFYEAPPLNPGHYSLQVAEKDLARLNLTAKQGSINFVTPAQGGDYEMPVISLLRVSTNSELPESTTVILNEENGEAFYFGDDEKASNIYVTPWEPRVGISGGESKSSLNTNPNYKTDTVQPLAVLPPSDAGNKAMRAEARSRLAAAPSMVLQPSSIASDGAMRAEAAGNFSVINYQTENSKPQPQPQIQPTESPLAAQYYTLQVGAYSESVNAERWLQRHGNIASACSVSRPNLFYIVDCGSFYERSAAVVYQRQLAQQHNIESTMVKAVNASLIGNKAEPPANSLVYTIQLLVAAQNSTLDAFIIRYKLDAENLYIKDKTINNRALKALSYGRYKSKSDAQQALSALPMEIQQQTWITQS